MEQAIDWATTDQARQKKEKTKGDKPPVLPREQKEFPSCSNAHEYAYPLIQPTHIAVHVEASFCTHSLVRVSFAGQALIHFVFRGQPILEFMSGSEAAVLRNQIGRFRDAILAILVDAGGEAFGQKIW
jgi:hypothetical protein